MSVTHPDQIHDTFTKAVNASDVDALLDLYDPDGVVVELDGSLTTGSDAMRASFEALAGAIRHIDGTDRKIFVAGDIALTSGSWTAEIELPDGTVVTQQGVTAEVSRRQADGTWRLVIDDPMFG
jgi:uncharacterized protein (TIGR02246 family)